MLYKMGAMLMALIITGCAAPTQSDVLNLSKTAEVESALNALTNRVKNLEEKLALYEQKNNQNSVQLQKSYPVGSKALNVKGRSYGGIVRSGPGKNYVKILSLREGDRVTLVERSEVILYGYPWFKIITTEGVEGYQWGGLICSYGEESIGVYMFCL